MGNAITPRGRETRILTGGAYKFPIQYGRLLSMLLQLLHSRNVLGTTKNNYNSFIKSIIPLPRGGSEFMLYIEVTGD